MIHEGFELNPAIEPLPLWKYQGLARDIDNAKKEITEHLNAEIKRFREQCADIAIKEYSLLKIREEVHYPKKEKNEKSSRKTA
jgi:hypothetical protein